MNLLSILIFMSSFSQIINNNPTVWVQGGVQAVPYSHQRATKLGIPLYFLKNLGADVWFYRINSSTTISEINEKLLTMLEMTDKLIEI